ncbi:sensor histidine kinase [Rossellomorea aquimaris]|uniref:histidine kinase n=1 Tax=Rossellomorea aquimaris TaxID=189382 RepID=A0A5D4UNI5_9BACI|nr:sensor histidine kinase [Rossellomorea aquimaris]TYS81725.1 sensor histidine kinase [Rossellomorea aquimaris]TYS88349.1 sensor histidine kinase [Rossellomorea aquimaris]
MELQIRPHVRMLSTIGKDLIKDIPAAIVELVKNAYDADASDVTITFSSFHKNNDECIEINIIDSGSGMSMDTIKNAWLVPSTDYKLKNKYSAKGRRVQGQKGIGRYAVAVLGNYLEMTSVKDGEQSKVFIDWAAVERYKYIEDVRLKGEVQNTPEPNGTSLKIMGGTDYLDLWSEKEIEKLIKELRKLISPFEDDFKDDDFNINLIFNEFKHESFNYHFKSIKIEPLPIINMYNYRLYGSVTNNGDANLVYENNSLNECMTEAIPTFNIHLDKDNEMYCGNVYLDLRVYDKDRYNLEEIKERLSVEPANNQEFNVTDVKSFLKDIAGAGIYRGGFRLRPHGDRGYDWLGLDNRRIQNPSRNIGLDQLVGFISIQPEEDSNLYEKSARDGLKENKSYNGLVKIIYESLKELEIRRYLFRKNSPRNYKTVYEKIEDLFDFSDINTTLKKSIEENFLELSNNTKNQDQVKQNLSNEINSQIDIIKKKKEKEYQEIKNIISVYQGQATLGNIVSIILHEGRKPAGYFTNQLPKIQKWIEKYAFSNNVDDPKITKSLDRLNKCVKHSESLNKLFNKLDPLTRTRKSNKKSINLYLLLTDILDVFSGVISENNVEVNLEIEPDQIIYGHEEDFFVTFTNLIENSIYWLERTTINPKIIHIEARNFGENEIIIDYKDNGPGIKKEYIDKGVLFQPNFTLKANGGSGLGLSISGEAINNNDGQLKAIYSTEGAHFQISVALNKKENNHD